MERTYAADELAQLAIRQYNANASLGLFSPMVFDKGFGCP